MMNPGAQGAVDPRVDLISRRLQQIQQMQEMAAMSGQQSHGAAGHGHSHDGQPCDGHSHDAGRMNMILERMQKFMEMQAQGGEGGQAVGTETQAKAMQAMQMIQNMQMQGQGGSMSGLSDGGGHGHSHSGGGPQHSQNNQSFEANYPAPSADEEKMQLMSGDIAANAPHRQKNWIAYTGEQGSGPVDSFLQGGGHFSPPEFGWGELIKDPQPAIEEKPKPAEGHGHSHSPAPKGPFGLLGNQAFKMPHETDTTGGIIYANIPLLGRIRFLTDKQGLTFWTVVVLYWIMGNYSTWSCILLPQYFDGKLSSLWLISYGIISALCITSHWKASTINPGRIPYFVEENSIDHPDWSFCHQCQRKRPPRAHHCRRCKQCVLKMDHHCPWINNCVGEENQWAFVLLIVYAQMLSSYTLALNSLWYWKMEPCQTCDAASFAIFHSKALINTVSVLAVLMIFFSLGLICSQNMGIVLDYTTLEWMQLERSVTASGKLPEEMPKVKKNVCYTYRRLCGDTLFIFWPFPCRRRVAPVMKRMEDV